MVDFNLEELEMIKRALITETIRREDNNIKRLEEYEELLDKVYNLIKKRKLEYKMLYED